MTKPRTTHFDTLSLHAGARPDPATGARATPIYQSSSYVFPDTDYAAALFNMERAGHVYSRISNPTCAVLEERIAALEEGVGAIATASGQAALHLAIVTLQGAGSPIVASRAKFPTLTEPYAGFHRMVFVDESTTAAFLLRARREGVRDFGACMAPFTAFQILQGIETLPLRMARHVENTRALVAFLSEHPMVAAVGYPELPSHPDHALAQRLLPKGCGAVFSFNLKGTRAQGRRFIETLRLFSHLANVGDAKSLVIHPASTTHFRMSAADLENAGITEGTIRLSVGLENPDDLIEDLSRALHAAGKL